MYPDELADIPKLARRILDWYAENPETVKSLQLQRLPPSTFVERHLQLEIERQIEEFPGLINQIQPTEVRQAFLDQLNLSEVTREEAQAYLSGGR